MQFRATQNDFTLILCPLSIGQAEEQNVGEFIDFSSIMDGARAKSGDCQLATAQSIAVLGRTLCSLIQVLISPTKHILLQFLQHGEGHFDYLGNYLWSLMIT